MAPIIAKFQPDLILVSAGFDGHIADPMRGFSMTTETYRELSKILLGLADRYSKGRILFCLEGGYDPKALQASIQVVWQELCSFERKASSSYQGQFIEWDRFQTHFRKIIPAL